MQAVGSRLRAAPPPAPPVCSKCGEKRVELRRLRALLARAEARAAELEAAAAVAVAAAAAAAAAPAAAGPSTPPAPPLSATPVAWTGASSSPLAGGGAASGDAVAPGSPAAPAAQRCLFLGSPLAPLAAAREPLREPPPTGGSAPSSVSHKEEGEDDDARSDVSCARDDAASATGCASSDAEAAEVGAAPSAGAGAPRAARRLPPLSLVAKPATEWSADVRLCQATGCGAEFGLLVWRHHCRLCGGAFCARCSSRALLLQPAAQPLAVSSHAQADAGDAPPRRGPGMAARRGYSEAVAPAPAPAAAAGPARVCEACYAACREQLRARRRAQRGVAELPAPTTLAPLAASSASAAVPRRGKVPGGGASGGARFASTVR